MVVARLCTAATARLQPALAGRGERRWLGTAAAEAGVARWEPMGAREYYDYRRAIYGDITHKAILVDAAGTLLAPTEPMAQLPKLLSVEDKLRNLGCTEIGRKIAEVEMDLTKGKSEGHLWGNQTDVAYFDKVGQQVL